MAETLVGRDDAGPASGRRPGRPTCNGGGTRTRCGARSNAPRGRCAAACHEELAALADEAAVLPRGRSNGGGGPAARREPVLNGAYLVPEARVERFHAAVAEMRERDGPLGLEFEVTGPWPPYNFVRLDLSLGAAA